MDSPDFYELKAFALTPLGGEIKDKYPDAPWGCFQPNMPEWEQWSKEKYFKGQDSRRLRSGEEHFEDFKKKALEKHGFDRIEIDLIVDCSRGFFKSVDDFEQPYLKEGYMGHYGKSEKSWVSVEDACSFIYEGYYSRLMLIGRHFGIDNYCSLEYNRYYEWDTSSSKYKKTNEFKELKGIIF